jgi:hypothetical protein
MRALVPRLNDQQRLSPTPISKIRIPRRTALSPRSKRVTLLTARAKQLAGFCSMMAYGPKLNG